MIKHITERETELEAELAALKGQEPKSFAKLYADNAQGVEIERLKMELERIKGQEPVAWMVYFDARLGGARVTDKLLVWKKENAPEQVKADLIQKVEPLFLAAGAQALFNGHTAEHWNKVAVMRFHEIQELEAELAQCRNELTASEIRIENDSMELAAIKGQEPVAWGVCYFGSCP